MPPNQYLEMHYGSEFEHKHYIGASKEFEILEELDGKQGFFIKAFFVNDKVNGNKWQITWEGIKHDAADVIGVPIVLQEDMQHPNFYVQNNYAKGYIVDYIIDEKKHELCVIARILDAETIKLIREGKLKFTSPAVVARDNQSLKLVNGVDLLTRWIALHLAIVSNPAYGKTDAVISGTCTGRGDTCTMKLKQLTAAMVATMMVTGTIPGSDSAKVAPITQIPLIKRGQVEQIVKREHELLDKGIPEEQVHQMLFKEFAEPEIDAKTASYLNYIDSKIRFIKTGSMEHNGKRGYWIGARGMKVFVSSGKSVDQAMKEQCPCMLEVNEIQKLPINTGSVEKPIDAIGDIEKELTNIRAVISKIEKTANINNAKNLELKERNIITKEKLVNLLEGNKK